jgi:hypothetical protein
MSMIRDLFETFLRVNNEAIFWIFFIFLIILIILSFFLSKANRECSFLFSNFFFFDTFFWKTSFITRFRTSFFFLHCNLFSFFRSQYFWNEQLFFFFYFFFQDAFYKFVMFSKFFKNFKFKSRCNQNDVDVCVKFVIHEYDFFFFSSVKNSIFAFFFKRIVWTSIEIVTTRFELINFFAFSTHCRWLL